MLNRLIELRDAKQTERENNDTGFTLIELLVVVVIIGILIAIAIPLYLNYQKGAANKSAASDTRNAVAVVEQCKSENSAALPAAPTGSGTKSASLQFTCGASATETANVTDGNTMTFAVVDATAGTYSISTLAGDPGDATYVYTSADGKTTH